MYSIQNERPGDAAGIDNLLSRAFNGGLKDKPANGLRRHQRPIDELCFTLHAAQGLAGVVRVWPVAVAQTWPALLLGPIAIAPEAQGLGLGRRLMNHTLTAAGRAGHALVFLVGDRAYYEQFGFATAGAMNFDVDLPAHDTARFLCAELAPGAAAGKSGRVAPWRCLRPPLTGQPFPGSLATA